MLTTKYDDANFWKVIAKSLSPRDRGDFNDWRAEIRADAVRLTDDLFGLPDHPSFDNIRRNAKEMRDSVSKIPYIERPARRKRKTT